MPINLFNNPLSSIKLGDDNILKGYIGNGQIFPNNTEIKGAAFTNSNIVNTGGNTSYVVAGDIGSSFTLTGSNGATAPSGTQVLSASSATYQIAIGDQSNTCGAASRNAQVVIAPQGNTTLSSAATYNITVSNASGSNKYYVDGVLQPDLPLTEGIAYTINQDDASNASHPLILSTSAIASGVYSTGVTYTLDGSTVSYSGYISGFAAASQRRLTVNLSSSSPSLNYICYYHQNMGNSIITSNSNNTDTITQAAGPPNVSNTTTLSVSITNTNRVTVTQGGNVLWAPGASFAVSISVTTQQTLGNITLTPSPAIGNWTITNGGFTPQAWNGGTAGVNLVWDGSNSGLNGVSGTANITIPSGAAPMSSVSASLTIGNINCYSATVTSASDTIYP